ncbi:hypothetical protein LOK74_02075 [Brevibacillus humidisoli]|uniref:hypothetical protein n=1 Tax=Brevibacillus humidisoli TaxID=2895522 RepID=UPI001E60CED5|nr:hypothetical protein [Brevibacillus humidisoli]UFJ41348.1 hypothetical protein LOK74_02075 [Brevibacillus humidisoli]
MKKYLAAIILFVSQLMTTYAVYAAKDNILVTGTKALLNDALFWILILIPVAAAVAIAWANFQKKGTEEPAEIAAKDKLIKKYIWAAIIGECSAAIVKLVLSYYGVTADI